MSKADIAVAVKSAREYRGMRQPKVAELLDITYQALSNYERGVNRIPVDMLQRLCEIYHISSEEVLRCSPWPSDCIEDFLNAASDGERQSIIMNMGYSDPALICQYCDLLPSFSRRKVDNLTVEDWELIEAYHAADPKSRAMVDLALAEYKEKAARSNEQAG